MKKAFTAFVAVAAIAGTLAATTTSADAQWRRRGPHPGAVIGGIAAGALLGAAIANSGPAYAAPPPGYYDPGPAYVVEEPACVIRRQRVWDEYRGIWVVRRVQVCD
jgi:hypothetical protein